MLTVQWGPMPREIRASVRPMLEQYLWLLPGWVRLLRVNWQDRYRNGDNDDANPASSDANPEYRHASLWVHAPWLEDNEAQRRRTIIHEILHVPLSPMVLEHESVVERLFEGDEAPRFKATLEEQWRQRFEGTIEDLTWALSLLPEDALPRVRYRTEKGEAEAA